MKREPLRVIVHGEPDPERVAEAIVNLMLRHAATTVADAAQPAAAQARGAGR